MNLYLVRHGRYTPLDVSMSCPLSLEGRAEISRLAHYFSTLRLKVPAIFHSAKLRAKQTAEIVKGAMDDAQCEFLEGLEPNDAIQPMLKLINSRVDDLMLVGHLPFIARLTDQLLSVDDELNLVDYQPGTAVCLSNDSGQWCIQWVLRSSIY
jgi:phosphohistidine phosphatase